MATKTSPKTKEQTVTLPLTEVRRLFHVSTELAELTEKILEENGEYSPELIRDLKEAKEDVRAGRVIRASSIDEAMKEARARGWLDRD